MNVIRTYGFYGLLLAALLPLTGCSFATLDDLHAYTQQIQARPRPPLEPLPLVKPYASYVYTATSLPDPFSPPPEEVPVRQDNGIRPDNGRSKEPLEDYPLDTLRMVGILQRNGEKWSLVKAPDRVIYRSRPGNYLGQNYGRILRVTDEKIELTEIIADGQGGWLERPAALVLNEESTLEKTK